ncbi:hypothetical protein [Haloquadratum walsbyi]|jgi:hypothetical protein|uniref:Uncharacterized protein n=1 Tax=Haloquadratum walsbyi J07HQW2 TaxID=1238425 RepID=U1N2A7_9EURY|nr:hypothetical protein [Haloquadratum walsbyi]ERG97004.1 MAG: hypothetical protein J07HQW2_03490 [Haloquadratum walsbyi J07HQW2]
MSSDNDSILPGSSNLNSLLSSGAGPDPSPLSLALRIGVVVLGLVILYLARPVIHFWVYGMLFSPTGLILFGTATVGIAVGILLFLFPGFRSAVRFNDINVAGTAIVFVFFLSIGVGGITGIFESKSLAERTTVNAEEIDELPAIAEENPRIVPRPVSDVQTRGSVSYRQHRLGTSDIARSPDGSLVWSYAIEPDPFRIQLTGNQRGVLLSDMTSIENRSISAFDDQDFKHGQNMFLFRSASWQLKTTGGYWSTYQDDPVEFVHDGTAYMAYPKTGHEWKLTPIPHTVPVWDGVGLVHPDGTIEHLSPEEAQDSEVLDGQRLYPLTLAREEAESLRFRNGIINQLSVVGSFRGVIEPASLPVTASNEQPFVIDTETDGMTYVMAMEPFGESTRGLDEVWLFDADSNERKVFSTGRETLLGPERAVGIVRSEDSRTNWAGSNGDGQFKVVEPIPVIIDSQLWWHTKVSPTDNTAVTRNVFVNADTEEAIELGETKDVVSFLAGASVTPVADQNNDSAEQTGTATTASGSDNIGYVIVVRDENGNVIDRIQVPENQTATIESIQRNTTVTTPTASESSATNNATS